MKTLVFEAFINAGKNRIWNTLWHETTYSVWTSVFGEGSRAISDWQLGSSVKFIAKNGDGIYSQISDLVEEEKIIFSHQGLIKDHVDQLPNEESMLWSGAQEKYFIIPQNEGFLLKVEMDTIEEYEDYFQKHFPLALEKVKELAETRSKLTIQTTVPLPVAKVWPIWTEPAHITQWNHASDDWHTTYAENDLQVGGKFLSRMAAKDGSVSFDFEGIYTLVDFYKNISYSLADGRKIQIFFESNSEETRITTTFDSETVFSNELQVMGWQAIIDNFKNYIIKLD